MNRSLTSLAIMNQLVEGCPSSLLCCHARAPEPAGTSTLPLTPALGAFIGPKQRNIMIVLEMASTAGTCHWVSTAPDGIDTTDEVFSRAPGASLGKALCLLHWIEQCRWDSMRLTWTPTRPNALPAGRSRTAETYLFANSNQCEPVQHAQQTKLVFRSHSLFLSPRLPVFLPFRCLRS